MEKLTYTNVNGYLIPNLTYKSGEQMEQLGKYGFLRRDYLKNRRNSTYQVMLLQDTIGEHLLEVDKAASGLCNGGVKSTGKLYQQRKVYRKNETVRMECKLDRETEAYHISEQGWKESA